MDNFDFYSPTYFAFGDGQETRAGELVRRFGGSRVLIVTGSGSVHRNGAFDAIAASLDKAGIPYVELSGVQPNPRSSKVYEGIELCRREKVVAVGEIGLDYYWKENPPRDFQEQVFRRQIELALELDLPVIIHDREAHGDSLRIVLDYPGLRGVFHCFSGSPEMAQELLKRGWYLGFDGPITYKNAKRAPEVAAITPMDRIVIETDAPYMAPVPFRGKRNDSRLLPYVVEKLAEWKGVTPEEMTDITWQNGKRLFGLE